MRASERMLRRNLLTALGLVATGQAELKPCPRCNKRPIPYDSDLCSECEQWEELDQADATEWARGSS